MTFWAAATSHTFLPSHPLHSTDPALQWYNAQMPTLSQCAWAIHTAHNSIHLPQQDGISHSLTSPIANKHWHSGGNWGINFLYMVVTLSHTQTYPLMLLHPPPTPTHTETHTHACESSCTHIGYTPHSQLAQLQPRL